MAITNRRAAGFLAFAVAALGLASWAASPWGCRTVAAPPAAANRPTDWIGYHSRKAKAGPDAEPVLAVTYEDGKVKDCTPVADAGIIAYLADRNWGHMPVLAIDLADRNRVLMTFDIPDGGKVKKAELVLHVAPDENRPTPAKPFDVGVYEVKAAWDEFKVTWENQPKFADKPAVKVGVDPKAKELRIDVTSLVRRPADKDAPRHGWLLKVVEPLKAGGPDSPPAPGHSEPGDGTPPGDKIERELLGIIPWAETVPEALERARREKKPVLACVRSHFDPKATTFAEQMLLTAVLADPDVLTLVRERFVPVRVCCTPWLSTLPDAKPDPLAELGMTAKEAKATALVVSDGGSAVARLTNIGTFDRDMVLRTLYGALAKSAAPDGEDDAWKLLARGHLDAAQMKFGKPDTREAAYGLARVASLRGDHAAALRLALPLAGSNGAFQHEAKVQAGRTLVRLGRFGEAEPLLRDATADPKGTRAAEAGYDLGCLYHRGGEAPKARAAWEDVVRRDGASPSGVRAKARLAWPEAVAMYENLTAIDLPTAPDRRHTEVDRSGDVAKAVRLGVDDLLARQGREGTWEAGSQSDIYRVAITAIVARSLLLWERELDGDRRDRIRAAVAKATAWLDGEVKRADAATMNSFGAAYLLDYYLDLEETKAPVKGDVKGAIRLLLGGQCPNGAWSYDLTFATNWAKYRDPKLAPGRTHSMNTGLALLPLARAKRLGFEVDAKALEAGTKALLAMRGKPGVYTYIHPGPRNFDQPDASAARGPLCEHALYLLGAVTKDDLGAALGPFLEYRAELRAPVKVWGPTWLPPHGYTSYFYFFAFAHAARAAAEHGGDLAKCVGEFAVDLLKVQEADGTWVDFEPIGKPYGTAMALHVLYLARKAGNGGR